MLLLYLVSILVVTLVNEVSEMGYEVRFYRVAHLV